MYDTANKSATPKTIAEENGNKVDIKYSVHEKIVYLKLVLHWSFNNLLFPSSKAIAISISTKKTTPHFQQAYVNNKTTPKIAFIKNNNSRKMKPDRASIDNTHMPASTILP